MSGGSSHRSSPGPFLWILIGAVWWAIFQVKAYFPYNGLLNPALAIHAVCRMLFVLFLTALLVRAAIISRRLRRAVNGSVQKELAVVA